MQSTANPSPSSPILSPKETQERQLRALSLQKLDREIEDILAVNEQQNNEYQDFRERLTLIEQLYVKQNSELRHSLCQLSDRYEELERLYLATKEELQACTDALQEAVQEKARREKEVVKLKTMIRNQEGLIDEYKRNINDELQLQKELIRSTFDEERAKLEKEFNHALVQMEKHYEEKIRKLANEGKAKEYQQQFQQLKKYLKSNKQNCEKQPKKSGSSNKRPISQYSTNDNDPTCERRHNQAVFILP